MSDEFDVKEEVEKRSKIVTPISVGITWLDGRCLPGPGGNIKRRDLKYYGICHYSSGIFLLTPLDWERATSLATIMVDSANNYCEYSRVCFHFRCKLNRFDRGELEKLFNTTSYTLGLPSDFGRKVLWFNESDAIEKWKLFVLKPNGGIIKFSEEKANKLKDVVG